MIKDAAAQGRLAFEHNLPMSSCEYPVGSSLRAEWMSGWTTAGNSLPHRARAGDAAPEQNSIRQSTSH